MQADIYAVKKNGAIIGYYAAEKKAKEIAAKIGGNVIPYSIIK